MCQREPFAWVPEVPWKSHRDPVRQQNTGPIHSSFAFLIEGALHDTKSGSIKSHQEILMNQGILYIDLDSLFDSKGRTFRSVHPLPTDLLFSRPFGEGPFQPVAPGPSHRAIDMTVGQVDDLLFTALASTPSRPRGVG